MLGLYALGSILYWAYYLAAVLITTSTTLGKAMGFAVLGVLPDLLLAPVALAYSRRLAASRLPTWQVLLRYGAGGLAFMALTATAFAIELVTENRIRTGVWAAPSGMTGMAWKELSSLLVYTTVCGFGNAIEQARRAARAESLRAQAQLASLRARLNPHFILNLLHTLMGLVARDPAAAEAALERLGDVLRYGLRVHADALDEVRLRDEWEFTERYLALERLRLGDRLRVSLDVDEDLLDEIVPAFSLQPLVENAVRHAIAPRAGGGSVRVTAKREGGALLLTVEDDGAGEGPGSVEGTPGAAMAPQGSGSVAARSEGSGLGLRLIQERLFALYGSAARLSTGPSALGGFRAAVTVPLGRGEASA
jgi:anti-sigma regulatory factor (Ser/Thr protein kinase)